MYNCLKSELSPEEIEERRQDRIRSLQERMRKSREIIDKETTKFVKYGLELEREEGL
jgi:hypothetical protein